MSEVTLKPLELQLVGADDNLHKKRYFLEFEGKDGKQVTKLYSLQSKSLQFVVMTIYSDF
jgi:hypothetical protein